jgi:hypothetical protein
LEPQENDFPKLFKDFEKEQFTLLWRDGRDGFHAVDFHRRCDGHPNTLTVILGTDGNICGRFTPVEWESWKWTGMFRNKTCLKAGSSLTSFLFTLKNPDEFPARRCALKAEKKDTAIVCTSRLGPVFNGGVRVKGNAAGAEESLPCVDSEPEHLRFGQSVHLQE